MRCMPDPAAYISKTRRTVVCLRLVDAVGPGLAVAAVAVEVPAREGGAPLGQKEAAAAVHPLDDLRALDPGGVSLVGPARRAVFRDEDQAATSPL